MMHVLIAFASAHGSTADIAGSIAEELRSRGLAVDLCAVEDVTTLDSFDAVVLGSAIHGGRWLPSATSFIESRCSELALRPLWLFSVSSVGDSSSVFGQRVAAAMRRMRSEPPQIGEWRATCGVRGHRSFAGVVQRADWGTTGTVFLRLLGGTYGDHRDWSDIARWGNEIADALV